MSPDLRIRKARRTLRIWSSGQALLVESRVQPQPDLWDTYKILLLLERQATYSAGRRVQWFAWNTFHEDAIRRPTVRKGDLSILCQHHPEIDRTIVPGTHFMGTVIVRDDRTLHMMQLPVHRILSAHQLLGENERHVINSFGPPIVPFISTLR